MAGYDPVWAYNKRYKNWVFVLAQINFFLKTLLVVDPKRFWDFLKIMKSTQALRIFFHKKLT